MNNVFVQYAQLIRNRRYFPLWLAQLLTSLGGTLHYIALVVWIYQKTGSSLVVAGTVFFEVVPVIAFAPVAGVIIDRLPRKQILIVTDIVRSVLVIFLLFTTALWQIFTIVTLLSVAAVFFNPTVNTILPELLDSDDLMAANSVSWSTGRLVQIIGSALAAGLIALVGPEIVFAFNASAFLVSALLLTLLPKVRGHRDKTEGWQDYLRTAREGLTFARQDPFVARLMLVQALASLSVGATSALLVVLAQEHYALPPEGFGTFLLAIGLGALIGPFLLAVLSRGNIEHPRWLFGPYMIRGIGDMLLAVFSWAPAAWLLLFIYGLNTSSGMVTYQTWVQRRIEDSMRGRVFTWLDVVWNVMKIVSLGIGAWLAETIGITFVYYVGGALLFLSGLTGLVSLRGERLSESDSAGQLSHGKIDLPED